MKFVSTDQAPEAIGPYSQAVEAGGFLFCSGQIALQADGTLLEGDVEAQTKQIFSNIDAVLTAGKCNRSSVVKCSVFLKDMNDFAAVNELYAAYFGEHRPARACVEVSRLPKDVLVEIEVIACVL
ncbi:MAG: RidA family protein [Planctomycetota bacterium]|jgi:2-iminobutanoate/2-iminopropanoate deaminase|nr:RidA family protein [Planctomycetota bacterium]MDP6942180.1 RidA family protein [Planctomycetota bacterium]